MTLNQGLDRFEGYRRIQNVPRGSTLHRVVSISRNPTELEISSNRASINEDTYRPVLREVLENGTLRTPLEEFQRIEAGGMIPNENAALGASDPEIGQTVFQKYVFGRGIRPGAVRRSKLKISTRPDVVVGVVRSIK